MAHGHGLLAFSSSPPLVPSPSHRASLVPPLVVARLAAAFPRRSPCCGRSCCRIAVPPHPVKFFGGLLPSAPDWALGREGPSVQDGREHRPARRHDLSLSVAGQPRAVRGRARARARTASMRRSRARSSCWRQLVRRSRLRPPSPRSARPPPPSRSHLLLGDMPDFEVQALRHLPPRPGRCFPGVGVVAGSWDRLQPTLLAALALVAKLGRWPAELRAGVIGAAVGVSHGSRLISSAAATRSRSAPCRPRDGSPSFRCSAVAARARAASYAAGTPGGCCALARARRRARPPVRRALPAGVPRSGIVPEAFAVVGMAAFFTARRRAPPLTGMVLGDRDDASGHDSAAMLVACFAAMLVRRSARCTDL